MNVKIYLKLSYKTLPMSKICCDIKAIVDRGILTPGILWRLPYIAYPSHLFNILSSLPPLPILFFGATNPHAVLFLFLNGWSRHILCSILLNAIMNLHVPSLGIFVPDGPWCVFYATRCQVYWGLPHEVVFCWYSDLISHTYTNTYSTLRSH